MSHKGLYARLRAEDPVHYMPEYDAWALACFEDVWQAGSDSDAFSVLRGQTPNQVLLGEPAANLTFPSSTPRSIACGAGCSPTRTPAMPGCRKSPPCEPWRVAFSNPL